MHFKGNMQVSYEYSYHECWILGWMCNLLLHKISLGLTDIDFCLFRKTKTRQLDADGMVIPELPAPSPLSISSLPRTPIDITHSPTPQGVEMAYDAQHSAIAEEVIPSETASLLDGFATTTLKSRTPCSPKRNET